jgi:uncharacterized protein (DUF1330 family)
MLNKTMMLAAMIASLTTTSNAHAAEDQPYYLVATISVADFDAYMTDYASIAIPAIIDAGGEILVGSREAEVLEGNYPSNWTVVVRFPSESAARQWYNSPDYQTVIPVRQALTNTNSSVLILAPQFSPPQD